MQRSSRVDYDSIAAFYDDEPYRAKSADPELAAFIAERSNSESPSLLDIACGTGNQLVANRTIALHARMVGLDGSLGMLRQARPKSPDIAWVQADAAALPFHSESFDFVSCQLAFHHMRDKAGMVREARRVLRAGGRLAIFNMCPQECEDWLYYVYFPEALRRDIADFWPLESVAAAMQDAGLAGVNIERQHLHSERDLTVLLETVRHRYYTSQLMAISDAAYAAGLRRIERELDDPSGPRVRVDHLCFAIVRGDKP
jgi:ubiquinone/menaquinone biosynthesis C-methylase UbiE